MQNAIRSNTISFHRPQVAAMAPICLLCTVCTVCTRIEDRFAAMVGILHHMSIHNLLRDQRPSDEESEGGEIAINFDILAICT